MEKCMSQSLSAVYIHIIFSTKERVAFIDENIRSRLWLYLGGICNSLDSSVLAVGGTCDHVHICCRLPGNILVPNFIGKLKAESSKWIKTLSSRYENFFWQTGYGVFSVNPGECDKVVEYINNQALHHEKRDFCDELRLFLKKYNIAYDEKYLWK